MAAVFAAANHNKKMPTPKAEVHESNVIVVPPDKEWESNAELGMLMLNG